MPTGKIQPKLGGVGWISRFPMSSIIWDMRRNKKKGAVPFRRDAMRKHSGTLRAAFREYQIKRKGAVTATARRRVRDLIAKRAGKVLKDPESETWRENLSDALKCTLGKPEWRRTANGTRIPTRDNQFRVEIHDLLLGAHRRNAPPTAQLHNLEQKLDCTGAFTPSDVEALNLLSELPNHLRISSGKWGDPALVDLVQAVGPVWRGVTGRSLKHTSVDAVASAQHSRFAKWLGTTFEKLGLSPPPQKRVTDIVRSLKI
ncbi:MAG: hypothetical protein HN540_03055 [Rhodospirillaceae bacterium]|jgi:hypothetical protein|nr:hypothetical protein [Rhodospirillaceae bacterium]MBT5240785.1 hypothetical protein [Rhodospirillaceae bacterium]MBT6961279.1 hypothetical protein [Rhodospirillaceae bacterium]